uniref:Uncharacterized protein n=1 Tax=viral metagenome TaxID=1070528 RepID=A0A6M3LG41_9ZZZZ
MGNEVMFGVDMHDSDGDVTEVGIYLHFGNTAIKIGETMEDFDAFVDRLRGMREELSENVSRRRRPRW